MESLIFSDCFRIGLKRTHVSAGIWAIGKRWEAEILQGPSFFSGTRNFIQVWK
jgi:hypothetical protein